MAFIDKLSEKISSGANAVSNSTKKVTETARINSEISRNTTEIDKRMKKIGLCVKSRLISQIDDPEVKQLAAEIDDFIARNEQLSEELRAVKGIRKCTNCGLELDSSSVFCPSCGTKNDPSEAVQNAQKTVVQVKAVKPAAESAPDGGFTAVQPQTESDSDGEQQEASTPEPAVEPVINPAPTQQTASQGIFCSNCGYRETPDALFCSNCGSKLIK
jgi:hypothetical protein